jgi:signal peptidase II
VTNLLIALVAVPVVDAAVKRVLRQREARLPVSLGACGSLQVVSHRLWLARPPQPPSPALSAGLLGLAAAPLLLFSALVPASAVFVGLLIGGALSNWLEQVVRGSVSDYICLRFWPAFNLADAAITAGAAGMLITSWTLVS